MGLQTKRSQDNALKDQGLSFSSIIKFFSKQFQKKKRLCAHGTEPLRGRAFRWNFNRPRDFKRDQDSKFQKSQVNNFYHPDFDVASASVPAEASVYKITAPLVLPPRAPEPSPYRDGKTDAASVVNNHEKPRTLLKSGASTEPSPRSRDTGVAAAVNAMKMKPRTASLSQSASTSPGHSSPSGSTSSGAESPETLYSAIHNRISGASFSSSRQDSVSFSSAANSATNKHSSASPTYSRSPFLTKPFQPSGAKFVRSGPEAASSPVSCISRDMSPSTPSVESDHGAYGNARMNYQERRRPSNSWADGGTGQFSVLRPEADANPPGRPFLRVPARSTGSKFTEISSESLSPSSLSSLSPPKSISPSKRSPECMISSSTNPSEFVRSKRLKSSRRKSADSPAEKSEQQSALSIPRSSRTVGHRSNDRNFSPVLQKFPSEPDLLQNKSKARSTVNAANDSRMKVSNLEVRRESGRYRSSPVPSSYESDKEAYTPARPGDVKVKQIASHPSVPGRASLWSSEEIQQTSPSGDVNAAGSPSTKQSIESKLSAQNARRRSKTISDVSELCADLIKATSQRYVRQSRSSKPSLEVEGAKGLLKPSPKSRNDSDPQSAAEFSSADSRAHEKTEEKLRYSRRTSSPGPQNRRSSSGDSADIPELSSGANMIAEPEQILSRAASFNSDRSKFALKFHSKEREPVTEHDSPTAPESRPHEVAARLVRKNSFSSVSDLLKSGRKSNAKLDGFVGTDNPSAQLDAKSPPEEFSVADNPICNPSPAEAHAIIKHQP